MKSVLIIAAHPDDEVLGCGGTVAKLVNQGVTVNAAFLADGVSSRNDNAVELQEELETRRAAAQKAKEILGVKSLSFADFPDNRMDAVSLLDIIKIVESLINEHQPDTVFTHHAGDLNVDHRRVHKSVVTACRPQRGQC